MDDERLASHLKAIKSPGDVNPQWKGTADVMHAFASFLADVEEEHAESAAKVERQTDKLIRLTWALVALTVCLLFVTLYLGYDVYLKERAMRTKLSTPSPAPNDAKPSNHAMGANGGPQYAPLFEMTSTRSLQATRALARGDSSWSR